MFFKITKMLTRYFPKIGETNIDYSPQFYMFAIRTVSFLFCVRDSSICLSSFLFFFLYKKQKKRVRIARSNAQISYYTLKNLSNFSRKKTGGRIGFIFSAFTKTKVVLAVLIKSPLAL